MKYYVVYTGKDVGWYKTEYRVLCVVTDEDVAKDFCKKFGAYYSEETVGADRTTGHYVKLDK